MNKNEKTSTDQHDLNQQLEVKVPAKPQALINKMLELESKGRYYRVYFEFLDIFHVRDIPIILPSEIKPYIIDCFASYFYHSMNLCKLKIQEFLSINTEPDALEAIIDSIEKLESFFCNSERLFVSLVDSKFEENVADYLKRSLAVDVRKEVNSLNSHIEREAGSSFNDEQVNYIVKVFSELLKYHIMWLRQIQIYEAKLIKGAVFYTPQKVRFVKKNFLDLLMHMVKNHIVLNIKNLNFKQYLVCDLRTISNFLNSPDFAKRQTLPIDWINKLRDNFVTRKALTFKKSFIEEKIRRSSESKTFESSKFESLLTLINPIIEYFDSLKEKKSELEQISEAYLRLMSNHQKLSTVVDKLKRIEEENANIFLIACKEGKVARVKKAYKKIFDNTPLKQAFYVACAEGQVTIVKFLASKISKKPKLARQVFNHFDKTGDKTPLMIAAEKNYVEIVSILVAPNHNFVDVELANRTGETALSLSKNKEINAIISARNLKLPELYGSGGATQDFKPVTSLDDSEINFRELVGYFEEEKTNIVQNQIFGLLKALNPYYRHFEEKGEPSSKILKWRMDYSALQIKFSECQNEENRLFEEVTKTSDLSQLRKLRKEHIGLVKKLNDTEKKLEELNGNLVDWNAFLPIAEEDKLYSSSGSSSSSSSSSTRLSLNSNNYNRRTNSMVNRHRLRAIGFDKEKKYDEIGIETTNYSRFFSRPVPKPTTIFRHIEVMGILDDFCLYKLETIRQYVSFFDGREDKSRSTVCKAMQTDALLFEIMQFMDKQAEHLEEAELIRNALVHCRGIIDHSLNEKRIDDLHRAVMIFARDLLSFRMDKLMRDPFCQKLIKHGKSFKERRERREAIDYVTRQSSNAYFKRKKQLYEAYQIPSPIEGMCRSALQMIHVHHNIYGLWRQPLLSWEDPVALRHRELFDPKGSYSNLSSSSKSNSSSSSSSSLSLVSNKF